MQTSAPNATPDLLDLDRPVKLIGSTETGTIVGRAEYIGSTPQYQVRYVNGQGCLNSVWWSAEAIEPLPANVPEQPGISAWPGESAADFKARAASATTTATPHLVIPALATGERYAGSALDASGKPTHHVVLLPEQPAEGLSWDEAMAWAASIGAELPTRQEAALLFANAKDAFEPDWHWTSEQYAGNASHAWGQIFYDGTQGNTGKGYKGRVRAVRRFLID